jgi:oligosaccharide repeat unit polymerase
VIEYLVLSTIATAMLVLAVLRLITSRFPSGADLAQVSTYYYSVPLSLLACLGFNLRNMAFLNEIAANRELAVISLRFVCLAMLSVEGGRYLGRLMGKPRPVVMFDVNGNAITRSSLFMCVMLLMFPLGIYLFGLDLFLQGYATESFAAEADTGTALIYSAIEGLGIALAFVMIMRLSLKHLPAKPLFFLSLFSICLVFVIRVKRLEVVSAMLPLGIILFASRSRSKATIARIAGGVGLLLLLAIVSATRVSERLDIQTVIFYVLSEGLYAGHSLPGIVNRIDINMTDYEYGVRFVKSLLAFVPSFVWSGKVKAVYGDDLIFEGISPLGATTMLTEIVLQGGTIAVILFYTGLGLFFQRIERFQESWDQYVANGRYPIRFGLYLIAVSVLIPHFRDGIIPAFKLSLQGFVFFLILAAPYKAAVNPGTKS